MTKEELEDFIKPFTPETKIIFKTGEDVKAKYMLSDDGEGFIILIEESIRGG